MEKVEVHDYRNGSNGGHDDIEKWSASEVRVEAASTANYVVDPEAEKRYVYSFLSLCTQPERVRLDRLVRRIDLRLVPASMLIYLLCFLDRSNIVS